MSVADELRQGAKDVFDALTGVPLSATYIVIDNGAYVPGGNQTITETSYSIRLIRDTKSDLAMALDDDVKSSDEYYMLITDELSVPVNTKDQIEINGVRNVIIDISADPVDAIKTLHVRAV